MDPTFEKKNWFGEGITEYYEKPDLIFNYIFMKYICFIVDNFVAITYFSVYFLKVPIYDFHHTLIQFLLIYKKM